MTWEHISAPLGRVLEKLGEVYSMAIDIQFDELPCPVPHYRIWACKYGDIAFVIVGNDAEGFEASWSEPGLDVNYLDELFQTPSDAQRALAKVKSKLTH